MADLILEHKDFASHTEEWSIQEDDTVLVKGVYKGNYPNHSNHTMSKKEALRQYALMTCPCEGWEVIVSEQSWHSFIDKE